MHLKYCSIESFLFLFYALNLIFELSIIQIERSWSLIPFTMFFDSSVGFDGNIQLFLRFFIPSQLMLFIPSEAAGILVPPSTLEINFYRSTYFAVNSCLSPQKAEKYSRGNLWASVFKVTKTWLIKFFKTSRITSSALI